MSELKPNSHKYKEERKIEKVVTGAAKTKKKNGIQKAANTFLSEDVQNVKSYIVLDVLIPALKKAVSDVVTNGIDMLLYGGSGKSSKNTNVSRVSYRNYYDRRDDNRRAYSSSDSRFDYDDIIFPSRGDAEAVLDEMINTIDRYKMVTVADMYDMANLRQPFTSNKFGWTNLRNASVVRTSDGYMLKLPKALPID